jgi:hypothetical protein
MDCCNRERGTFARYGHRKHINSFFKLCDEISVRHFRDDSAKNLIFRVSSFDFIFKIQQQEQSTWSRGMIPASGAGGPEFDSRSGPYVFLFFSVFLSETRSFGSLGAFRYPDVLTTALHCATPLPSTGS